MDALTLALALALGPGDLDDPLPLSLSESFVQAEEPTIKVDHAVLVGLRLGLADRDLGDNHSRFIGFQWRIHAMPWLAVGGSIDYQTSPQEDKITGGKYFQVPFMWEILLSPPFDLGPFRPYILGGGGFTATYVNGDVLVERLDFSMLYFTGFGLELELSPTLTLDAGMRYITTQEPTGSRIELDWSQFTIGVFYRMTK